MAVEMTSLVSGLQQSAALEKAFGPREVPVGQGLSTHLVNAGEDFVQTLQSAEAMSIKGIKGEASAYEVASAVMEAECHFIGRSHVDQGDQGRGFRL